jgi:hypothetical protein
VRSLDAHVTPSSPRTRWPHALLLLAFGTVSALLFLELSVRIATHSLFTWGSSEPDGCCVTDPMVGRVIATRGSGRHPDKRFIVTVGEHGIRLNGREEPPERPLTLAVGDSFAFGDGVDDAETWPAVLESVSGTRVINAGMFGFGLDQAVLRAEQLVDVYRPDTIVLGFIAHDVVRCELSYWSGFSKPYFDLDPNGTLRFHPAASPPASRWASIKRLLAYSRTVEFLFPSWLHWEGPAALAVHHQGREVACRLMERLASLGREHGARIVVMAHPQQPTPMPEERETKDAVLACAVAANVQVVDLFPLFDALPEPQRARLFDRHFTPEGYHLVGAELARRIAGPTGGALAAYGVR